MRRGFTLLEVLLAMLLMGLVILACFSLYSSTAALQEETAESGEMMLQAQFAFRTFESDIRSAWVTQLDDEMKKSIQQRMDAGVMGAVAAANQEETETEEDNGQLFVGEDGTHELGADDYVELITAAGNALGEAKGDLVRARYYLMRNEEFPWRSELVRTSHPFLAPRLGGTDRSPGDDEFRVVARGVVGFDCRYKRVTEWRDAWNSQQEGKWPVAVDVEITLQSKNGRQKTFSTQIYLRVPTEYEPATEEETEE